MKKVIYLIILALINPPLYSQNSEKNPDSYTIQRLIIENDKKEILIYKGKSYWMTPAIRHNKELSIKEGLQQLAKSYGLKITQPKLAALYTYKFGFKKGVSFRSFYTADLIGSNKTTPPSPITQAKWAPISDVTNVIGGLEVRKQMLNHILQHPETLWGGSFYLYDDEQGVRQAKILERFYSLR